MEDGGTNGVGRLENSTSFDDKVFLGFLFNALEFIFFVN